MTSADIQELIRRVRKARGMLRIMQQNPSDNYHWSAEVAGYTRDDLEDLLNLAALGAQMRDQARVIPLATMDQVRKAGA